MKVLDVFYYYYYLFYTKVLPDDEPHATVVFTLSFSEALLINYSINVIGSHFFCKYLLGKWEMISIIVILNGFNYLLYLKTGRGKKIVKSKPIFFNNHYLSLIVTLLFFLITSSFLFWVADYAQYVISHCG